MCGKIYTGKDNMDSSIEIDNVESSSGTTGNTPISLLRRVGGLIDVVSESSIFI